MQLPWRFIRKPTRDWPDAWPPTATQLLVAASAAGYLGEWMLAGGFHVAGATAAPSSAAVRDYAALSLEGLRAGRLWQPLSCLFLPGGAWSLVLSLAVLCLAGRNLESVVGRRHLFAIYVCGGVLGSAGQLAWHSLEHGVPQVTGASSAVMAVFVAFACTMPELEVTPLLAMAGTARARGVRVKHVAVGTVLASAVLLIVNPGGQLRGSTDLSGWVIGCLAGAVYMRALGFGRRATAGGDPAAAEHEPTAGWAAKGGPNSAAPSPAARGSGGVSSPAREVATIATAGGLIVPRFTERERRMSAREYITEQIDPILDKILLHGLGSLTDEERRVLEKGREKMRVPPRRG